MSFCWWSQSQGHRANSKGGEIDSTFVDGWGMWQDFVSIVSLPQGLRALPCQSSVGSAWFCGLLGEHGDICLHLLSHVCRLIRMSYWLSNTDWGRDDTATYVWLSHFTAKVIPKNQYEPSWNFICHKCGFFSFVLLILSSGHAHAVTRAVVVNQKILIENTGKRETGNIWNRSYLELQNQRWLLVVEAVHPLFLSLIFSSVFNKESGSVLKHYFRKLQLFELSVWSL